MDLDSHKAKLIWHDRDNNPIVYQLEDYFIGDKKAIAFALLHDNSGLAEKREKDLETKLGSAGSSVHKTKKDNITIYAVPEEVLSEKTKDSLTAEIIRHYEESEGNGIFPPSVDLLITEECNLNCHVCWGSYMPEHKKAPVEKQKQSIDILYEGGARRIIFTGGEPLLEQRLSELISHAHKKPMTTVLFTNSLLLSKQKAAEIMPHTDFVSLSLDGYDESTNSAARKKGHFTSILKALELFKEYYPEKETQILTVVTKINKDYLNKIGNLLADKTQGIRFQWKLNYYNRIGRSEKNYPIRDDPFFINYEEFKQTALEAQSNFSDKFTVRYSPPVHDKAYLFVFPDGVLSTTQGAEYIELGNILKPETYNKAVFREITQRISERSIHIRKDAR